MNKENLQRMADYIKTIHENSFDMGYFRRLPYDRNSYECQAIGCVIGHCTVLDEPINIPRYTDNRINFSKWSEKFTGLSHYSDKWDWCFNAKWQNTDDTPIGASKRIEYLLEYGLPDNWHNQMIGKETLIYKLL